MATLAPASRHTNIERSLEAYITQHIVTGLTVPVIFPNQERLESVEAGTVSRWGDVFYIGLDSSYGPYNIPNGRISIGRITLNLNLFEYKDHVRRGVAGATRFSLKQLSDRVCELFPQWEGVPIYDYDTSGNPQVDALVILEQPYPKDLTEAGSAMSQVNVSVPMQYNSRIFL